MYTGTDNFKKTGMMTHWNGKSNTGFYPDICGDVKGTTGELWPPAEGMSTVKLFSSDMCRLENYKNIINRMYKHKIIIFLVSTTIL